MTSKKTEDGRKGGSTKAVKDARLEKVVHPRSRKALQLRRSQLRVDRLHGTRSSRVTTRIFPLRKQLFEAISRHSSYPSSLSVDRFTWFQLALDPKEGPLNLQQVKELIETYLDRQTEEINRLRAEQRQGRPLPKRLDQLLLVQGAEKAEYEGPGFELPDLANGSNLEAFRHWDGTRESLDLIRTTRVRR